MDVRKQLHDVTARTVARDLAFLEKLELVKRRGKSIVSVLFLVWM